MFLGDTIVYSDPSGDYLILGSMMDAKTRSNMTTDRMNALNSIPFEQLPFAKAIKVVKGNGKRSVAVFSDPDCPFCHQLEDTLAKMTDVTIYTFLYPIASLHPDAANKARNIWCAQDKSAVWTQWMQQKKAILARQRLARTIPSRSCRRSVTSCTSTARRRCSSRAASASPAPFRRSSSKRCWMRRPPPRKLRPRAEPRRTFC